MDFRSCSGAALLLVAVVIVGWWPAGAPAPPVLDCDDGERIEVRGLQGRGEALLVLCPVEVEALLGCEPAGRAVEARCREGRLSGRARIVLGEAVELNAAEAEDLEALPGVGPGMARRIVQDRAERGPFSSVRALTRVRGLGPARLRSLEGWIVAGAAR